MATYSIDTAKAIDNLVANGVEEKQARAIVETFILTQDDLLSKKDLDLALQKLRTDLTDEIQTVRTDLTDEIQKVRTDMTGEIQKFRTDKTGEIQKFRTDLTNLVTKFREDLSSQMSAQFKWIIGTVIGVNGLLFAVIAMFVYGLG